MKGVRLSFFSLCGLWIHTRLTRRLLFVLRVSPEEIALRQTGLGSPPTACGSAHVWFTRRNNCRRSIIKVASGFDGCACVGTLALSDFRVGWCLILFLTLRTLAVTAVDFCVGHVTNFFQFSLRTNGLLFIDS